jgi:hypothetical protein
MTRSPPNSYKAKQILSVGINHVAGSNLGLQHPPIGGIRSLANSTGSKFSNHTEEQTI